MTLGGTRSELGPLLIRAPDRYAAERRYILDLILGEWMGLEYELQIDTGPRLSIQISGDPDGHTLTMPDILFSFSDGTWLKEGCLPTLPLVHILPDGEAWIESARAVGAATRGAIGSIPVLYGETGPGFARLEEPGRLALSVDVFGSAFFMLTRMEEIVRPERDDHGRFPLSASLAAMDGFVDRALVDEYVDLLWLAMRSLWPRLGRRSPSFRLILTHDVDVPFAAWGRGSRIVARGLAGDLAIRRDVGLARRRITAAVDARSGRVDRDPFNTFDFLMETSERHDLRSTFFFMAGAEPSHFDAGYRLSDLPFTQILRRMHERGHEIGLHPSYASFRSRQHVERELAARKSACQTAGFEQPEWGARQHYLRLDVPRTWRDQMAAGIAYDSTLGFAEQPGFRAGTCREFPLFDLTEHRPLKLRERPLLAMDATLFEFMGLDADEAASRIAALVRTCRRHGGDAVLLYHNNRLLQPRRRAHYQQLVRDLSDQPDATRPTWVA